MQFDEIQSIVEVALALDKKTKIKFKIQSKAFDI